MYFFVRPLCLFNSREELQQFEHPSTHENLRLPKGPSMVSMKMQPMSQTQPVSTVFSYELARGRGRGRAAPQVGTVTNGFVTNGGPEGKYSVKVTLFRPLDVEIFLLLKTL